jgi:hypothetical protein
MSTTASDQTSVQSILTSIQTILSSLGTNTPNIDTTAVSNGLNAVQIITAEADEENKQLLLKQNEVKALVDNENQRIQTNIQLVEDNLITKKRMVEFNENQRLRTEQYNQIMLTFVLAMGLVLVIVIGGRFIPFLPEFVLQGLIVIIGLATVIQMFTIYSNIQARSHMNYNELHLDKPAVDTPEEIRQNKANAAASGDLLGSIDIGGCAGPACCDSSNNVVWNESSRKCVQGFENMDDFLMERLKYNKNIALANSPSEINMYSII